MSAITVIDNHLNLSMPDLPEKRALAPSTEHYSIAYGTAQFMYVVADVNGEEWEFCKTKSTIISSDVDVEFARAPWDGTGPERVVVLRGDANTVVQILQAEIDHYE